MRCQKCKLDFPEKEIQLSHDIPKYVGGTDKDGRHYLCKKHHKEYEQEVLNIILMALISDLPKDTKKKYQWYVKKIKNAWFKKEGENGHSS